MTFILKPESNRKSKHHLRYFRSVWLLWDNPPSSRQTWIPKQKLWIPRVIPRITPVVELS